LNTGTVTLNNGSGDTTTFTGGLTVTAPSSLTLQGTVQTTNTTMTLGDANTGITNNGTFSNPAILNAGTGIINLAGNVTGNGSNNPLKVITSGAGSTTASGVNTAELQSSSGVVTIANPSDQTGGYRISGGTLQGGTMAKVGYIYAQTGTSILAPGINGPGMMHTNFLSLSSGNTLQIDLQGTIPGTSYDQIIACISGNVNLNGATLNLSSTFLGNQGTVFTIIDNQDPTAAIQGTFAGLSEGAVVTVNGRAYQISYVGGTGNDVTLTVYDPATVTSFTPTIGKAGTSVVITGTNFTNVSQVSFNGTVQPTYTVNSPTQITTTIPSAATTGTISITTIAGTATSSSSITIDNTAPTLNISASPGSLKANETSTITFTFSEVVTGFSSSIITVTNGTITNPVASSSTVYTATFTPTLGIKADGTIAVSNNYFDLVGNQGTAATLNPPIAINTVQTPLVTGGSSSVPGGASTVSLIDPNTGQQIGTAVPFPGFSGEIRVVSGDVNGDGRVDIIAGAGPGGGPAVAILDSQTGQPIASFFAYDPQFTGGVFVSARDVNNDGILDIITGAGAGGGPHVKVFDGSNLNAIRSFFAYDQSFTGGVTVAAIDLNGDNILDLVTGAGPGGGPHVKVFDGATNSIISQWFAYPISFTGGVYVAAGDIGNDGNIEVVTGAGSGGAPVVAVWDPYTGALLSQFMAYAEDFTGGVRVGVSDGNFDGILDLVTGAGPGGGPQVNGYNFP
ncbi:MAG: Ig-like domain-containing protein, partial [Planctomycetia bacterium]